MANIFEGKKVLITGGRSGFLGINFANAIVKRGAKVIAQGCNEISKKYLNTNLYAEAIEDFTESTKCFETDEIKPDYVIHCAAFTGGATLIKENPMKLTTVNTHINTNVLDAAHKAGVKKFVYISSSAIYPESDLPVAEWQGFIGDPEENFFGIGWMKRYGEKLGQYYSKKGMDVLIIRPSNVYGPYSSFDPSHSHVIPALIRRFILQEENPLTVWGREDVIRDFIYTDDFVRGVLMAFESFEEFDVYNIATGIESTIGETVNHIKELTNYDGTVVFDSTKPITKLKQIIDVSKAKKNLGFECEYSLRDGLEKTINWYKENK
jgi:GDP-L-fucose synthase